MNIIGADQVNLALDFPALIDHLARGLAGDFHMPQRQVHALGDGSRDAFALLPAWNADWLAVKAFTYLPDNAARQRDVLHANILLFERATGAPRALLDGVSVTCWRTAAVSALAARHLARRDAQQLLLLGTGKLAPYLVHAHLCHPALRRVSIWGRDARKAARLAAQLGGEFPRVEFAVCSDVHSGAASADLIVAATGSAEPLLHGAWLQPGTHVDLLGNHHPQQRECDTELACRATIFADSRANVLHEAGELLLPIAEGQLPADPIAAELADLCAGRHPGRQSANDITLFKSVGMAIADLLAADLVVRQLATQVTAFDSRRPIGRA